MLFDFGFRRTGMINNSVISWCIKNGFESAIDDCIEQARELVFNYNYFYNETRFYTDSKRFYESFINDNILLMARIQNGKPKFSVTNANFSRRIRNDDNNIIWKCPIKLSFVPHLRLFSKRVGGFLYQCHYRIIDLITESLLPDYTDDGFSYYPGNVLKTDLPLGIWIDVDSCHRDLFGCLRLWEFQEMLRSISDFDDDKLLNFSNLLSSTTWEDALYQINKEPACYQASLL